MPSSENEANGMIICARPSDREVAEVALLELLYKGVEAEIKYSIYIPEGQVYLIDPSIIYDPDMKWTWDAWLRKRG